VAISLSCRVSISLRKYIYMHIYIHSVVSVDFSQRVYIYIHIYLQRCECRFLSEILSLQRPHSLSYSSHSAVTVFCTSLRVKMTKNKGKKKESKSLSLQTESLPLQRCECLFLCHSLNTLIYISHTLSVFLALSFSHSLSLQR